MGESNSSHRGSSKGCEFFAEILATVWAVSAIGCEKVSGLDEYTVGEPAADPARVAAFLGGDTTCDECVRSACLAEVSACSSDSACADAALCMGSCTIEPSHSTDPACVVTKCRSVSEPVGRFRDLTNCAIAGCREPCAIGKSWGCSGKYNWPRATKPFDLSYKLYLFSTSNPFTSARAVLCDRLSPVADCRANSPPEPYLIGEDVSDAAGVINLRVEPNTSLDGQTTVPRTYNYLEVTDITPFATRMELGPQTVPLAYMPTVPVLWTGMRGSAGTRFFAGIAVDCRGSRVMAAAGLKARWVPDDGCCRDGPVPVGWQYWDARGEEVNADGTSLSGVFDHFEILKPGIYRLELFDRETGDVRESYDVTFPADHSGHITVFVFPPTADDVAK